MLERELLDERSAILQVLNLFRESAAVRGTIISLMIYCAGEQVAGDY